MRKGLIQSVTESCESVTVRQSERGLAEKDGGLCVVICVRETPRAIFCFTHLQDCVKLCVCVCVCL